MPTILIATDNTEDAKMVELQLAIEFENIFTSTDPDTAVQDFESHRPDVLMLAFNTLEKAERYYLGLYRLSSVVHTHPHRTVILCNKNEVDRVYELCKKDYFNDYILFWPISFDTPRLPMSVHHAMRVMTAIKANLSAVELATQARQLAKLESLLDLNVTQGNERIETASNAIARVEQEVIASLDGFSQQLTQGDFARLVEVKDANGLQHEIGRLQQEDIHDHFNAAIESMIPIKAWAQEFQQKCAPHLESARALRIMAEKVPATIMVVDDDEFARKLLGTVLAQKNYELMFAASGMEALNQLRKQRPDLILMDMIMPDIDGMKTMLSVKSIEQFSTIPVIMVTGNSEKRIVANCLKAGAADFVVKPFNREILLDKIHKILS